MSTRIERQTKNADESREAKQTAAGTLLPTRDVADSARGHDLVSRPCNDPRLDKALATQGLMILAARLAGGRIWRLHTRLSS